MEDKQKILIVDDERMNRNILVDILKPDYHLFMAKDGEQAIKRVLSENRPDLVLLDVVMPGIDGYEVCTRLKADNAVQDIPIIFITSKSDAEDETRGFEVGAVDYISKPFNPLVVKARVRTHLELKRHAAELRKSLKVVESVNRKLTDSIRYAKVIQESLLPLKDEIKTNLPDSFIIWMPKDIVGGDIYYTDFSEQGHIIALLDSTGHGVPGAFMSMLGFSSLRRIIREEQCYDPALILKRLNSIIKTSLHQDTEYAESDDGMDAGICFINPEKTLLTFAGAGIQLTYIQNNNLNVIRGDRRQNIGYKRSDLDFDYTNHQINIGKNIVFYINTDGYVDQLGGKTHISFGKKRFQGLLLEICEAPFEKQKALLTEAFYQYKGDYETIDDVSVIGFGF